MLSVKIKRSIIMDNFYFPIITLKMRFVSLFRFILPMKGHEQQKLRKYTKRTHIAIGGEAARLDGKVYNRKFCYVYYTQ